MPSNILIWNLRHNLKLWLWHLMVTLNLAKRFFQERIPDAQTKWSTSRSKLTSQPSWVIENENATAEWASAMLLKNLKTIYNVKLNYFKWVFEKHTIIE